LNICRRGILNPYLTSLYILFINRTKMTTYRFNNFIFSPHDAFTWACVWTASDYCYFFPYCTDKRTTKPHQGTVFDMSFSDHMSMYAYATGMIPSGIGLSPCFSRCHTDGRTSGPRMPHLSLHLCQYFCYTTYAAKITCLSFRIWQVQ
jgi:hypothetical protein